MGLASKPDVKLSTVDTKCAHCDTHAVLCDRCPRKLTGAKSKGLGWDKAGERDMDLTRLQIAAGRAARAIITNTVAERALELDRTYHAACCAVLELQRERVLLRQGA